MLRNILIFHSGALGDFVLSWPLALALGRLYPQSRVFYVTTSGKGKLAEHVLKVESLDSESGWQRLHVADGELPEACGRLLGASHSIFSFVHRPGDEWEANVRRLAAGACLYPLQTRPPEDFTQHATEFLMSQLSGAPAIHGALKQMLASIGERGIGPASHGREILLHPGAGSRRKCWPIQRFAELAKRLLKDGKRVGLLLGEVEQERLGAEDLKLFPAEVEPLMLHTPVDLAKKLCDARMLVGNDSGPAHLAGIMGVPVVCLFGATNPTVWRPPGPRVRVLHHNPLEQLETDAVLDAMNG